MTTKRNDKTTSIRHALPGSDYGLVRRVARRLGKSESLVSAVKRGVATSRLVAIALTEERKAMKQEAKQRRRRAA